MIQTTRRSALKTVDGLAILACVVADGSVADAGQPLPRAPFFDACYGVNPYLVTTSFVTRHRPAEPAVIAFRDTPDNSDQLVLATQADVGATYGLAYAPADHALFAAAYIKRGAALGPAGPGGIYRIELDTGAVRPWASVPDAGADPHNAAGDHWPDVTSRDAVGRTGLGDVDLSEDGRLLFVTNLADRRIYRFRVADSALEGAFEHGAAREAWAAEARPFGLKAWRSRIYHGVVNSQLSSTAAGTLSAHVYSSLADGSDMRRELSFDLDYPRGQEITGVSAA